MIPSEYTDEACDACKTLCNSLRGPTRLHPHSGLILDFRRGLMELYHCNKCGYELVYNGLAPERTWQWGAAPSWVDDEGGGGDEDDDPYDSPPNGTMRGPKRDAARHFLQ